MKFEDFLDYIIIKDKAGNTYPVNKEQILKCYEKIRFFIEAQRNRTIKKRTM
jgi:hypothetical protein